ncbi:MAG: hypothetical protein ACOC23_09000 [Thermodesulfobacteriota bacterium]
MTAENRQREILQSLDGALNDSLDEFDRVAHAFALAGKVLNLISEDFGRDRLDRWRQNDDPALLRFASGMKNFLEQQKIYLDAAAEPLLTESGTITRKIADRRREIDQTLAQENTMLNSGEALLSAENELRTRHRQLETLQNRLNELSALEKELADIDLDKLRLEVSAKETRAAELKQQHRPLLDKKCDLETRFNEMREAMHRLSKDIEQLSSAHGEAARELTGRLPEWVARIRARADIRSEKAQEYLAEMAEETERLAKLEAEVQNHLDSINAYADAAAGLQDVLTTHFNANRELSRSFAKSLGGMEEGLQEREHAMETALSEHDEMLRNLQRRIRATADTVKQLRISD